MVKKGSMEAQQNARRSGTQMGQPFGVPVAAAFFQ